MKQLIGYGAVLIGIIILLGIIGLDLLVGPLIFAAAGIYFLKKRHRWIAYICFTFAVIVLFESVLHIHIAGILIALLFIYIGYRLFNNGKKTAKSKKTSVNKKDNVDDWINEEIDHLEKERYQTGQQKGTEQDDEPVIIEKTPEFRGSLIGDLRLINHRYELKDMNLSYGIGDNKIDLSKAIIHEGENTIVISGLIGDVDIYIPYDLDVSIAASVTIGNLEVLGYKMGGLNRQINLETKGYKNATRKVKISISNFIGDIDVRYL
ncbi:cell wall-active antibiotics response protein LiaF [Scopulibacillus cellulosilyticus]|uniref:Cell wall-active antibiotics response protein LiaF n=1 Tax=Scopulibacillus cellulosilyticus TaxID=2665665 RepID=A0ABW2Q195_9BACL